MSYSSSWFDIILLNTQAKSLDEQQDPAGTEVLQSKNSFSLFLQKDSTYFFKNNNQNTVRIYYEH